MAVSRHVTKKPARARGPREGAAQLPARETQVCARQDLDQAPGTRLARSEATLKALAPTLSAAEEIARTGLREAKPRLAFRSEGGDSESGDRPTDRSEVDEARETELPVPAGELLAGRYVVERIFAEGGMGIVCLGRHAQLEQPVAIKFLRRALAGKASVVERFLNEGRALAALRSEHVVKVMDVGQLDSGRPYLVMEHLEGTDLGALVAHDGPLPVETAVAYALQICEPLAEAHALGIVHRDIKPENLFLWSGGPGKDIVKVLDFGLAKQFGGQRAITMTGPQDSIGSPCYMSPEQITTPQSIDSRTDIWSLGVVLHHLLTDGLPFDGLSIIEVLSHVLSAAPKSLHEALPDRHFDPALDAIVTRCLEKNPEARYQTMADLAAALGDYLAARRDAAVSSSLTTPQPPAPLESPPLVLGSEPLMLADDEYAEKVRIPGLKARWPGALVFALGLAAAALYLAHSTGKIRVQTLGDGWLYPAHLGADVPLSPRTDPEIPQRAIARGVYATEPTHEVNGALALRAVPEVNADGSADADGGATPISAAERARREAAYRAYLRSQSLIPLREIETRTQEPANVATPESANAATPESANAATAESANTPAVEPANTRVDVTPDPPPNAE
jgi:serine/threonine protein kinase